MARNKKSKRFAGVTVDPKSIYQSGCLYYDSCMALRKISDGGPGTALDLRHVLPITIMSAFTIELFLKCLYAFGHKGQLIEAHNLLDLFQQIDNSSQYMIAFHYAAWMSVRDRRHYDTSMMHIVRRELETKLKEGGDTFTKLRYAYEKQSGFNFALYDFPETLKMTIESIQPEWKLA